MTERKNFPFSSNGKEGGGGGGKRKGAGPTPPCVDVRPPERVKTQRGRGKKGRPSTKALQERGKKKEERIPLCSLRCAPHPQ